MENKFFVFLVILIFIAGCSGSVSRQDIFVDKSAAVAVWNLDDLSPIPEATPANFGELLSGAVIESFQESGKYKVVEREKLLMALEELSLGSSELADESTRLRVGELVGARWMVFGGYQVIGEQMRLDMRRVDVETSLIVKAAQKTVSSRMIGAWIDAAKEAAGELL